jgi:hypothetical protein
MHQANNSNRDCCDIRLLPPEVGEGGRRPEEGLVPRARFQSLARFKEPSPPLRGPSPIASQRVRAISNSSGINCEAETINSMLTVV